jgi:hypothetical protein
MLRSYSDITDRLGPPLWWDEQGCPRYDAFEPRMLGVYESWVCLYEIACQACDQRFKVAESWNEMSLRGRPSQPLSFRADVTIEDLCRLHYGDPPRHECLGAGETMNCLDLRILEFWAKDRDHASPTWFEWVRVPEVEKDLPDQWWHDSEAGA